MGTSAASEPLNFFIIVIYNLLIVFFSFFMTAPLEMVAVIISLIYLIDITNIDKIYITIKLAKH